MKRLLIVLALVVGFAVPAMAETFPNLYAVNCIVNSPECK
jgi:hypothetical protein